jgi:polyisoprenoid-binding protein YceI
MSDKPVKYRLDPSRSTLGFTVKHLLVSKVQGLFREFSGELDSKAVGRVSVLSIETGDQARDQYLRTNEFFDPVRFPEMRFQSTALVLAPGKKVRIEGELTIKDQTRSLTLEGEMSSFPDRMTLDLKGKLSRKDFGLLWPAALEAGGMLVGDRVDLQLELSFLKA